MIVVMPAETWSDEHVGTYRFTMALLGMLCSTSFGFYRMNWKMRFLPGTMKTLLVLC